MARIERLASLEAIEAEIADKKTIITTAKLLPTRHSRLRVAIGSVVELIDKSGHQFKYTLVDSIEANPSDGRISTASPLGSSLLGRTVQDIILWGNGQKLHQLQLVRIA